MTTSGRALAVTAVAVWVLATALAETPVTTTGAALVLGLPCIWVAAYMIAALPSRVSRTDGQHVGATTEGASCAVVVAVRNEPVEVVAACIASALNLEAVQGVILADDDSTEAHSREYAALAADTKRLTIVRVSGQPLRQFGAQLAAAKTVACDWIAILDCDYVVRPEWIAAALRFAEPEVGAIGFPQDVRSRDRVVAQLAGAAMDFEFFVENPYRQRRSAQTISGTMILVRRALFVEYYDSVKRAWFTSDYGFGLWLHSRGVAFEVVCEDWGAGLPPASILELAKQQAKWADDLPQYIAMTIAGGLGFSPVRHWHLGFHAIKTLFPCFFYFTLAVALTAGSWMLLAAALFPALLFVFALRVTSKIPWRAVAALPLSWSITCWFVGRRLLTLRGVPTGVPTIKQK